MAQPKGIGAPPKSALIGTSKKGRSVNWEPILAQIVGVNTVLEYGADRKVFSQGQPADAVFYLRQGKVKLSVISQQGKEAIVAVLGAGDFLGEGCLAGQPTVYWNSKLKWRFHNVSQFY